MRTNNEVKAAFNNGTSANANNLHTDGARLWSYSTVVAMRHPNGVTLITSKWYSNTTAHHLSGIRFNYEVPNPDPRSFDHHMENMRHFDTLAQEYEAKATKARKDSTRERYKEQAARATKAKIDYYAAFLCRL